MDEKLLATTTPLAWQARNPQPATRNSQPATRNHAFGVAGSQPATRNPQLATGNWQLASQVL